MLKAGGAVVEDTRACCMCIVTLVTILAQSTSSQGHVEYISTSIGSEYVKSDMYKATQLI